MGRNVILLIASSILIFTPLKAQKNFDFDAYKDYFQAPVDIPIYLSGNFGELRSTHFHAGIDIKTQGVIGKNILAAAEGYVSRIKIQTGGYGKSLYIAHPNGLTTVYAHLNEYVGDIASSVKNLQYAKESFELDVYLEPGVLNVKKGELIALSGNTGSSGGPHLHFEIRETSSQIPLNGLLFNFDIKDDVSPVFRYFCVYPLSPHATVNGKHQKFCYLPEYNGKIYTINAPGLTLNGPVGFGIEAYDYMNFTRNRYALHKLSFKVNNKNLNAYTINGIGFHETANIRGHIDYDEKVRTNRNVQKSKVEPNNDLNIYDSVANAGTYVFLEDSAYLIEIKALDAYGNVSDLKVSAQGGPYVEVPSDTLDNFVEMFHYEYDNFYKTAYAKVYVPGGALFSEIPFTFSQISDKNAYSDLFYVHNEYTALKKSFYLSLKPRQENKDLFAKMLLAKKSGDNFYPVGGSYRDGFITAASKEFGAFKIIVDTVAPKIVPVNIWNKANMAGKASIRFAISDEISGVESFKGYINNQWVLFEYDPKTNALFYNFDEHTAKGQLNELELYITDAKGNMSTYSASFYF